jgi:DNA adenine methylase
MDYTILNKPLKFRYSVLRKCSELLSKTNLGFSDFEGASEYLGDSDKKTFCYLDPPYVQVEKRLSVIRYGLKTFGIEDQERLAAFMHLFSKPNKRTWLMMSNAAHNDAEEVISRIFSGFFLSKIMVDRKIGSIGQKTGELSTRVPEYLVTSYPITNNLKSLF